MCPLQPCNQGRHTTPAQTNAMEAPTAIALITDAVVCECDRVLPGLNIPYPISLAWADTSEPLRDPKPGKSGIN